MLLGFELDVSGFGLNAYILRSYIKFPDRFLKKISKQLFEFEELSVYFLNS